MPTVNQAVFDRGLRHAIRMDRFSTRETNSLIHFLNGKVLPEAQRKLRDRLVRARALGGDPGAWTTKRLKHIIAGVNGEISGGLRTAGKALRKDLQEMAVSEAAWQRGVISGSIPRGINVDLELPSAAQLKTIIASKPFKGKVLSKWWGKIDTASRTGVEQAIKLGLASGETTPQIIRRLAGTEGGQFMDGVFGKLRRNVASTTQTAISHVSAKTRDATYAANSDIIKGVQIVATLDSRTTEICMSEDGRVYPIDSGPRPPLHWNCRSTTIPVTKSWDELGLKAPGKVPVGSRASMNGQVSARTTYGKWLRKQPKYIQDEALGKGKAEMFRSGRVSVKDFVDNKRNPLTLAEVKLREELDDFAEMAAKLSPEETTRLINEHLRELKLAGPAESRKLRGKLRRLGHKGGLKGKAPAPPVEPPPIIPEIPPDIVPDIDDLPSWLEQHKLQGKGQVLAEARTGRIVRYSDPSRVVKITATKNMEGEAAIRLRSVQHPGLANVKAVGTYKGDHWIVREAVETTMDPALRKIAVDVLEGVGYETSPYYLQKDAAAKFITDRLKKLDPKSGTYKLFVKHRKALVDLGDGWAAARRMGVELTDFDITNVAMIKKRIVLFDYGDAEIFVPKWMREARKRIILAPKLPLIPKLPITPPVARVASATPEIAAKRMEAQLPGVKVEVPSGMSKAQAKAMTDRFDEMANELNIMKANNPQLAEVINGKKSRLWTVDNSIAQTINSSKGDITIIGEYLPGRRRIGLSQGSRVSSSLSHLGRSKFLASGNSYTSLFRHEYGHAIQHSLSQFSVRPENKWGKIFTGHNKAWWKRNVSEYSAANYREAFAESFGYYTHPSYGVKFRLPKDIEKYFDTLLKGTGGARKAAQLAASATKDLGQFDVLAAALSPVQKKTLISDLLVELRGATKLQSKRVRTKLRRLGHKGGLGAKAGAAPTRPKASDVSKMKRAKTVKEWEKITTKAEIEIIEDWGDIHSPFETITAYQRGRTPGTSELRKMVKDLESAFAKAPTRAGRTYRGIQNLSKADFGKLTHQVGKTLELPAFTSTSRSKRLALDYAISGPGARKTTRNILFVMDQKSGVDIQALAKIRYKQKETLLRRGTKFRVTKVVHKTKRWRGYVDQWTEIHVTEVPSKKVVATVLKKAAAPLVEPPILPPKPPKRKPGYKTAFEWQKSVSDDQYEALNEWVDLRFSTSITKYQRTGIGSARVIRNSKALEQALSSAPRYGRTTTYRGMSNISKDTIKKLVAAQGKTVKLPSVTATSEKLSTAQKYLSEHNSVLFEIQSRSGADVSVLTGHKPGFEVLLLRNTRIRILEVRQLAGPGKHWKVLAREI